jgi:hypothetical protein
MTEACIRCSLMRAPQGGAAPLASVITSASLPFCSFLCSAASSGRAEVRRRPPSAARLAAQPTPAERDLAQVVARKQWEVQISEFPTGDFGSNRQAVSGETDRPFRSKGARRCGVVSVPALANRRCGVDSILLWSVQASTLVSIIDFGDCGRL